VAQVIARAIDVPRQRVGQASRGQVNCRENIGVTGVRDDHGFARAQYHAAIFVDAAARAVLVREHQADVRCATLEQAPKCEGQTLLGVVLKGAGRGQALAADVELHVGLLDVGLRGRFAKIHTRGGTSIPSKGYPAKFSSDHEGFRKNVKKIVIAERILLHPSVVVMAKELSNT